EEPAEGRPQPDQSGREDQSSRVRATIFRLPADDASKILFRASSRTRGSHLETVGLGAGYGHVLEAIESASVELARFRTVSEVADSALGLALRLTRSSVAFLALVDENGDDKRVFSMAADPADSMPRADIEQM